MRTRRSTVLVGILAGGLALTQQACSAAEQLPTAQPAKATSASAATPAVSSAATPAASSAAATKTPQPGPTKTSGKTAANPILAGRRQVVIKPIQEAESIVAVDAKGRLSLTDGEAEHGLFVFTPSGGKYLIKTAKAGSGGEPSCMGIKNNGSASLTVVAAACDAGRAGQLFTITKQKQKDASGRPTYAISQQSVFLQIVPDSGLIAQELGDAPLATTFAFVDNGPSTLPALD